MAEKEFPSVAVPINPPIGTLHPGGPLVEENPSSSNEPPVPLEPQKPPADYVSPHQEVDDVPPPPTPEPPVEMLPPWKEFTRHQQFEDYWQEGDLGDKPDSWDVMTIAQKKQWMDDNIEP